MELTLPGRLRLVLGKLGADCFHPFANGGNSLPAVRRRVNQLFTVDGKLRSESSNFAEQGLDF